jgi:beta-galactosidase/beta-glucuronidase
MVLLRLSLFLVVMSSLFVSPVTVAGQGITDQWRYTLRRPTDGWQSTDFDDSAWSEGNGGFGIPETPGARVGTNWSAKNIWLRKSFDLATVPDQPALLIHHDDDAQVYINGQRVATFDRWTTDYKVVPLNDAGRKSLQTGHNILAVHCRQDGGDQYIDVHLVDADNVPKLPAPERSTTPFLSELITEWGAAVTPQNAWREYPRPLLVRHGWQNLNGQWKYAIAAADQTDVPEDWDGSILVPYCLESKLSGVQRRLDSTESLWYRRTMQVSVNPDRRTLLNFEAVEYRCEVYVNGRSVGAHQGGNTAFTFDVTNAVRDGDNELIVRVQDDTEGYQLRGKQTLNPRGIWYTQVSGIWQTVWLEQVSTAYIRDLKIQTDAATGTIRIRPDIVDAPVGASTRIRVLDGDTQVAQTQGGTDVQSIIVPDAKLWSPDSPHLYGLRLDLLDADGNVLDMVGSYTGIRTVGKMKDEDGHWRFTLNGKPIFHWGPLDQGWWPDGLLTPPSDEGMLFDIEYLKSAGFNMIRKHIKVEPRRYYYHCDRLGMMVWQDQVSAGNNPPWTRLKPNPKDADWPDQHHNQFMVELEQMINTLENHPCIVVWVPFNEAWGQHRTMEVGKWVVKRDPSRSVNVASGGNFWPVGDVVDHHSYPNPEFPFAPQRYKNFIKVMGEFGGHGYPVRGHLWDANRRNWGYGDLPKTMEEYRDRYVTSLRMLDELRHRGIAAGIYTQTTDVEGEINGLMTYDRKVIKIPAEELAKQHALLFDDH